MKLTINGKVYGWNVIFDADIHLTTGTVIKHQFYKFREEWWISMGSANHVLDQLDGLYCGMECDRNQNEVLLGNQ